MSNVSAPIAIPKKNDEGGTESTVEERFPVVSFEDCIGYGTESESPPLVSPEENGGFGLPSVLSSYGGPLAMSDGIATSDITDGYEYQNNGAEYHCCTLQKSSSVSPFGQSSWKDFPPCCASKNVPPELLDSSWRGPTFEGGTSNSGPGSPPQRVNWDDIETDNGRSIAQPLILSEVYVLQGDPEFIFDKETRSFKAMDRLDRKLECQKLAEAVKEASGDTVRILFNMLTVDTLHNFFSVHKCSVLHISTHGAMATKHSPSYLAFEDDTAIGCMRKVQCMKLARWISKGGRGIRLCFVASCYAGLLGKAFVNAGIPHVVSCHSQEKVHDKVALDFETYFYKYLLSKDNGFNIQEAFDLALIQTKEKYGEEHGNKFCLLPRDVGDTGRHRVPIQIQASSESQTQSGLSCATNRPLLLPPLAPLYQCRPEKQYEVRKALLEFSYVSVSGGAGVGKTEIVKAACHYLHDRLHFNIVRQAIRKIVWCPYDQRLDTSLPWLQGNHSHYNHLEKIFEAIRNDQVASQDLLTSQHEAIVELMNRLHQDEGRVALIIEAKALRSANEAEKMSMFVKHVFSNAADTKILVIHNTGYDFCRELSWIPRYNVVVEPMDYTENLSLFIKCVRRDAFDEELCEVSTPSMLHDLLSSKEMSHILSCQKCSHAPQMVHYARHLFHMLGKGKPGEIIDRAQYLTPGRLDEIVRCKKDIDNSSNCRNRAELCKKLRELRRQLWQARDAWDKEDLVKEIRRLETLKLTLLSLPELEEESFQVQLELAKAEFECNVDNQRLFARQLEKLQERIQQEKLAQNTSVADHDLRFLQMQTRSKLDSEILERKKYLDSVWKSGCNWSLAQKVVEDIKVLESRQKCFPSAQELLAYISDLEERMRLARLKMNVPVAAVIDQQIRIKKIQLEAEERFEPVQANAAKKRRRRRAVRLQLRGDCAHVFDLSYR